MAQRARAFKIDFFIYNKQEGVSMAQTEKYVSDHPDFVYSSTNRILHWIRALVITGLIITGFYIADPFLIKKEQLKQEGKE